MARHGKRRTHAHQDQGKHTPAAEPHPHAQECYRVGGAQDVPAECRDDRPEPNVPNRPLADNPGAALRAAREARGLSIEDLTRTTKITRTTLLALEHNELDKLPATIFTRGFLKAYAHEVGLDPEATADRYLAQVESDQAAASPHRPTPTARAEPTAFLDAETAHILSAQPQRRFGRVIPVAAAVGLVFYVWSFSAGPRPRDAAPSGRDAATDGVRTGGEATTAADATAASATPVGDVLPGSLQFELRLQGPCWLAANVDGSPVFAKLLQAGDDQTIEVRDELVLRVGDPSALSFSINGQSGRVLGRAGEPVNVRITKDNFREFLSS